MTPEDPGNHLASGEVAAYLDRALPPAERERVEAHLADCAECRREVIEVSRLRHTRLRRTRWMIVAPAAAAAAIVFLVLARPAETPGPASVLREGADRFEPRVALVSPSEGGVVGEHPVVFTWRSAGAGVSYRLTVTDKQGDILWSATAADTTARLATTVGLRAGSPYYWYVDGLLPDGRSVTSGVRPFTVRP